MTAQPARDDIVVCVCHNCSPQAARLPRQWSQSGAHIRVREIPCSGKTDTQYLFHAIEGGSRGVCVVACPLGECKLAQGNYRANVRIRTLQRLLEEIGLEPERAQLVHCSPTESADRFTQLVHDAVERIATLQASPLAAA